ncbi:MAG TPA: hypothetical protein VMK65_04055 [Longimicrobiales bacterium]|nr:hypothetical protein [Longimicrobiales bacterium]
MASPTGFIAEIQAMLRETPHYALDEEEDFDALRSDPRFGALLPPGRRRLSRP